MDTDVDETYVQAARRVLTAELPGKLPEGLLDLYVLLVLACGETVVEEDVHDAWAVWCSRDNPGHNSLLPFAELPPGVQELDEPYVDALRRAASRLPWMQPAVR